MNISTWTDTKEKTMKKTNIIFLSLIVTLPLLLAACFSDWTGQEKYAAVTIRLAGGDTARTLVASDGSGGTTENHTYKISIDGAALKDFTPGVPVSVPVGSRTLEIRAYGDPAVIWGTNPFTTSKVLRAIGKTSGNVTEKGPNSFSIYLDSASEVTTWEQLKFAAGGAPDGSRKEIIVLKNSFEATSTAGTIPVNRPIELRADDSPVTISREIGFYNKFFNVVTGGSLYIGKDSATGNSVGFPITLDTNNFTVLNATDWNNARGAIAGGDNNENYVITVASSFTVAGTPSSTFTFGAVTGIAVTITGNQTITLSGTGSLLNIGADQSVVMHDIDLEGHSGNNTYLVAVNGVNASLTMEGSASVSGNTAAVSGGGVYVADGGSFAMLDGTISGNSVNGTTGQGGGVYVSGASATTTFTMSGGTISNNTITGTGTSCYAGGVYVSGASASFTMTDGIIGPGNTSTRSAGGVMITSNATFTMSGGEITGNSATSYYGGLFVSPGILNLNSPASKASIHTNTVGANSSNALVASGSTFKIDGVSQTLTISW